MISDAQALISKEKHSKVQRIRESDDKIRQLQDGPSEEYKAAWNSLFERDIGGVSYLILQSFCLEIYLKCLHRIRGREPPRGHDQKKLFYALSRSDRSRIEKICLKYCSNSVRDPVTGKVRKVWDTDSVLDRSSDLFTKARYGYELPVAIGGNAGMQEVIFAIDLIIIGKHPDWLERFARLRSIYT